MNYEQAIDGYKKYKSKYTELKTKLNLRPNMQSGGHTITNYGINPTNPYNDYHVKIETDLKHNNPNVVIDHFFLPIEAEADYECKAVTVNYTTNKEAIRRIYEHVGISQLPFDDITSKLNVIIVSVGTTSTQCYLDGKILFTSQINGIEYFCENPKNVVPFVASLYSELNKQECRNVLFVNAIAYLTRQVHLLNTENLPLYATTSESSVSTKSIEDSVIRELINGVETYGTGFTSMIICNDELPKPDSTDKYPKKYFAIKNSWDNTLAAALYGQFVSRYTDVGDYVFCVCDFGGGGMILSTYDPLTGKKEDIGKKSKIIVPEQKKFSLDMLAKNFTNPNYVKLIEEITRSIKLLPENKKVYICIGQTGKPRAIYFNLEKLKADQTKQLEFAQITEYIGFLQNSYNLENKISSVLLK